MAKYSITFYCYLFSCFVAVVPNILEENVKSQINSSLRALDPITFHSRRGVMAILSEDQLTVTKKSAKGGLALVYTNRRLELNELFEIKITEMEPDCNIPNPLTFGMFVSDPDTVLYDAFLIDSPSWMIHWTHFFHSEGIGIKKVYTDYLPYPLKEGDRLGVLHKTGGDILFYINGRELPLCGSTSDWGDQARLLPVVDMHGCYKSVKII